MSRRNTHQVLNQLLTIVYRSLPMYLTYANPWTRSGDEKASSVLARIVEDQRRLSIAIADYLIEHDPPIEMGEYPLDFPDTHDLSLDYLITKLVGCQRHDVAALEQCVAELAGDRSAQALAEEALGAARGHLESLEELNQELAKAPT